MTYTESARAQLDALQVKDHVRILALETSCDETAAAIIEDGRTIVSNIVFSQIDLHALYGGVVPEIASRAHVEACDRVIDEHSGRRICACRMSMPSPSPTGRGLSARCSPGSAA